jgi:hypothetical protein
MSDLTVAGNNSGVAAADSASSASITSEKVTYRRYVKYGTDSDTGKTVIKETRILAETDKKAPAKLKNGDPNPLSGLSVNWATAEEEGFSLFSENEVVSYDVKSFDGAAFLVPDEAVRLYIFQVGLSSVQTARANGIMKAIKEGTPEPEPEFNAASIDLRVGTDDEGSNSINRAPARRSMSDLDKLIKQLTAMGIPPERQAAVLAALVASQTPEENQEEVSA